MGDIFEQWEQAMRKKGHVPVMGKDNRLDHMVLSSRTHNGPGCSVCGQTWCWHCVTELSIQRCQGGPEACPDVEFNARGSKQ